MNTAMLLAARFESPTIPLDAIAEEFFGLSPAKAQRYAGENSLPVPAIRLANSVRSPWLVHIDDLASHIDTQRKAAKKSWEASNSY